MAEYAALMENEGRIHIVELKDEVVKHKGLGVLNIVTLLADIQIGEEVLVGQKYLTRMPTRLPELIAGMARRAQTITAKDAGSFITRLGVGSGDTVLEAGLGSGGLSLHLARVLGSSGHLITAEPRTEHANVGLLNLERAEKCFAEFPKHTHLEGMVEDVVPDLEAILKSGESATEAFDLLDSAYIQIDNSEKRVEIRETRAAQIQDSGPRSHLLLEAAARDDAERRDQRPWGRQRRRAAHSDAAATAALWRRRRLAHGQQARRAAKRRRLVTRALFLMYLALSAEATEVDPRLAEWKRRPSDMTFARSA